MTVSCGRGGYDQYTSGRLRCWVVRFHEKADRGSLALIRN
jgi:hypothetical protein